MTRHYDFKKRLEHKKSLGLDASVFIYYFEGRRKFSELLDIVFAPEATRSYLFSTVGAVEVLTRTYSMGDWSLLELYINIFENLPGLRVIPLDFWIADKAAELRAKYQIKTPDAIHIASAIERGAEAFITNDAKLKIVKELPIICLSDFI